jgi:hypothetical protein
MDESRLKGTGKQISGSINEAVGKVLVDEELTYEYQMMNEETIVAMFDTAAHGPSASAGAAMPPMLAIVKGGRAHE